MLKQLYSDTDKINSILDSNKKPAHSIGNRSNNSFVDSEYSYTDKTLQYTLKTDDVYVKGTFTNYEKTQFCILKGSVINVTENNKDFFKDVGYNKCILKNHIVVDLLKNTNFTDNWYEGYIFNILTMIVTGINKDDNLCKQLSLTWTYKILAEDNGE
nr:MAG TPA: hypothetical protein [Caudoviricetes sp.]